MKIIRMNPKIRQRADFLVPKVVFEDSQILVLDKPAGMVVNRAESVKEKTVQDWVEEYLEVPRGDKVPQVPRACGTRDTPDSRDTFLRRAGVVHRLDKETSGLLLVAKTPEAFVDLQKQFKERRVEKKYLALVHGQVEPKEGEIKAPVGRLPWQREKFGVLAGGRKAETKYKVLSIKNKVLREKKEALTLLELRPETGRTHQLRVHLKFWGHPIVADDKYAGRKRSRQDRKWCPRLFLHACFLAFTHPKTGKRVELSSSLPQDLKKALEQLK